MRIGLIDEDNTGKFPNIPLMKISAYHKSKGDEVFWYDIFSGHCDMVYCSKVFSFSNSYPHKIDADEIIRGGSGYAIKLANGKEVYDKSIDKPLPYEIEHIYPDYSIYPHLTKDTAFGFLTRGCPRGCFFCHVKNKEGLKSVKVANLEEFWRGQKNIILCDPNILACRDWRDLFKQLEDSKATIDFNQGLDARLLTEEKIDAFNRCRIKEVHFAWDRYQDKDHILPKLEMFSRLSKFKPHSHNAIVYVLCNYDTTFEQDLERIDTLRDMGYWAYVMVYDKQHAAPIYNKLQRWVNNRFVFHACKRFSDYDGKR